MMLSSGDSQRSGVSNVKPLRFVDSMAKKSASEKSVNELSLAQLAAGLKAPAKAFADAVRSIAKERRPMPTKRWRPIAQALLRSYARCTSPPTSSAKDSGDTDQRECAGSGH